MTLATRCSACGTVFRIVRDQLRVSDGWVRCGRCQETFNALDNLFDLEREAPPPWAPPTSAPDEPRVSEHGQDDHAEPQSTASGATPAGVPSEDASDFADARYASSWPVENTAPARLASSSSSSSSEPVGGKSRAFKGNPVTMDVEISPEFIRRAERAARWRRPQVRFALSLAALVLAGTLTGQVTHHFRDWIAALWPQTLPSLQAMCVRMGCQVEAVRHIDSIAVDSSGLSRANGMDAYKLSVTLRNRSGIPVALPDIDLTLTDPQGQLISRRALTPAEMGASQNVLAPGTEVPLQVTLATGERRVFGYTVDIFYP